MALNIGKASGGLSTPSAGLGGKKGLLKSMLRGGKAGKMKTGKASLKGMLSKPVAGGMKGAPMKGLALPGAANPGMTLPPPGAPASGDLITGGGGANLGTNGIF